MYCKNCGEHLKEDATFCANCGIKVRDNGSKVSTGEVEQNSADIVSAHKHNENKKKLQKNYTDTGNSSIALCIFGYIATVLLSYFQDPIETAVGGAIILVPLLAPFFVFGRKLKNSGIENLNYAMKISKGMLIYTLVFVVLNVSLGGKVGFLWLLLAYYYYKSYKETKIMLFGTK